MPSKNYFLILKVLEGILITLVPCSLPSLKKKISGEGRVNGIL